jgi:hypothetical protein
VSGGRKGRSLAYPSTGPAKQKLARVCGAERFRARISRAFRLEWVCRNSCICGSGCLPGRG